MRDISSFDAPLGDNEVSELDEDEMMESTAGCRQVLNTASRYFQPFASNQRGLAKLASREDVASPLSRRSNPLIHFLAAWHSLWWTGQRHRQKEILHFHLGSAPLLLFLILSRSGSVRLASVEMANNTKANPFAGFSFSAPQPNTLTPDVQRKVNFAASLTAFVITPS